MALAAALAVLTAGAGAGLSAGAALAAEPGNETGAGGCGDLTAAAEREAAIPSGLLQAIGRVESGRANPVTLRVEPWPWTVNTEGRGHFFAARSEAVAFVREAQARGVRSIDVGCMQVNLLHHPAAFASLEEAFDPAANVRYAAGFLVRLHQRSGDWTTAAGEYHSATPALGGPYARLVLAAMTGGASLPRFPVRETPEFPRAGGLPAAATPAVADLVAVLVSRQARLVQIVTPASFSVIASAAPPATPSRPAAAPRGRLPAIYYP